MFPGKFNTNMASRAQEQFLNSLRHTLLDLARRLQQDTVSEDVGDYVLFRLEQISRHLVLLADNMQVFDTVRTSLATVTRMLSEVERNWHYSSPAVAYQPRTVGHPRFEIPREQLQYLVDYEITIPEMSRALLKRARETFRLAKDIPKIINRKATCWHRYF